MKSTKIKALSKFKNCLSFQHVSVFTVFSLLALSYNLSAKQNLVERRPAAIEEEVLTVPLEQDASVTNYFAEDDAGIMKGMKDSLDSWEKTEEFADVWDLQSTGLYTTPSTSQKRKYISNRMLKYADKRFSGEMKKADEGSALHKIGRVEKQLRPNASVAVSKFISLKFKARVLQGKATVELKNPWIECSATVGANGKAKLVTRKDFAQLGFATGVDYTVNNSEWIAYADQQVTQNIKARVSSTQEGGEEFMSNNADARVEMTASFPFNL
jgi:hypothetical protein